ncbi:HAD family acid phosphatase [Mycoplasma sp. ATU-Cv-508]|uniref:HAD family acid phosphatase n=1 Tax=Mycoplasma sp. ATU-Cv-508 TaxID=2048001 RepID=UPI000FDF1FF3
MLGSIALVAPATFSLVACQNQTSQKETREEIDKEQGIRDLYYATLWQTSAERRALIMTQYQNAKSQFKAALSKNKDLLDLEAIKIDNRLRPKISKPRDGLFIPLVVMDIDETILDNTLYQVYLALSQSQGFKAESWHKWTQAQKAPIYPGVIEFAKLVWNSGAMVAFVSNRRQGNFGTGDELVATRANLIKEGYPSGFLDSYLWWTMGSLPYGETQQNEQSIAALKLKESRYEYINEHGLSSREPEELGLKKEQGWQDELKTPVKNLPVQIIMRVGDDLNDFNDHLTKGGHKISHQLRHDYLDDLDIAKLFGQVSPRVKFEINYSQGKKMITKRMHPESHVNQIDNTLVRKGYVDRVAWMPKNSPNIWETYLLMGGNSTYGGWLSSYQAEHGKGTQGVRKALEKYWIAAKGDQIFA